MAAQHAASRHTNPITRGAGLRHEDFHRGNLSSREALWSDIYLSLPYGKCAVIDCRCMRFRIHPQNFEPDKADSSQLCLGCHHDQSFHAIGEEREVEYGLKTRKTLFQYITLLEKKALFSSSSTVKEIGNADLKHAIPAQTHDSKQETKPRDVVEIVEAMRARIDAPSLPYQQSTVAPGNISPSRAPSVEIETETGTDDTDDPATATSDIASQEINSSSSPAQTHSHVPKSDTKPDSREGPKPWPGQEPKSDAQRISDSEELSMAAGTLREDSQTNAVPPEHSHVNKSMEGRQAEPLPPSFDKLDGRDGAEGSFQSGQPVEPPLNFHMHQDSVQTVEPFDMSQNSSGSSSPVGTPVINHEDTDRSEHEQAPFPISSLDRTTHVLVSSGIDLEEVKKRLQPSSPEIREEERDEHSTKDYTDAAEQSEAQPQALANSPQTRVYPPRRNTQESESPAAVPSNDWNYKKPASPHGPTVEIRTGRSRPDAEHQCHHCQQVGHHQWECRKVQEEVSDPAKSSTPIETWRKRKPSLCPTCHLPDHTAEDCPGMERAHLVASPAPSRATSHKERVESPAVGISKSRHALQELKESELPFKVSKQASTPLAFQASPVAESNRGRPETRNFVSTKHMATLPTEPILNVWEDNENQLRTDTKADGRNAYKAWWLDDETNGSDGNDGASDRPNRLTGNGVSASTRVPAWGGFEQGSRRNNDEVEPAGQSHTDAWNGWADEVEQQALQVPQAPRRKWGDLNEETYTGDRRPSARGRGRGRGNFHPLIAREIGPSGKDRRTKPAQKAAAKPHSQTPTNLHVPAAPPTTTVASTIADATVRKTAVKEGGGNKAKLPPQASATGEDSKYQNRNLKPIKHSPPGQGSVATHLKRDQRRRRREREAAELASKGPNSSMKDNQLHQSPTLNKKNTGSQGKNSGKRDVASPSPKQPSTVSRPETPWLIDV